MIKQSEYKKRRQRLLKRLDDGSVALLFASRAKQRSHDTNYAYRQDSNFFYLSGFGEDNSALLFIKSGGSKGKVVLFVEPKDATKELWEGKRVGLDKAKRLFDVDEICSIDELTSRLKEASSDAMTLYYEFAKEGVDLKMFESFYEHKNLTKELESMRLIKSKAEIKTIKKAINITAKAFKKASKMKKVGKKEYQIQAKMEMIFAKNGAKSVAYESIVASGNNANTLHYIKNDRTIKKGDLILIDAGCELENYASDITRTMSASKMSKAQKQIYDLVLSVNEQCIKRVREGRKRSSLQRFSEARLAKGLKELGILKGSLKKIIKKGKHKRYFPHGIGHHMGLDVHDGVAYRSRDAKEIALKKGMIITIEPALYIDKNDKKAPKKYRGIGIRIEDDILVTKKGYKNLSKKIPK